jgi:hypothetical protein
MLTARDVVDDRVAGLHCLACHCAVVPLPACWRHGHV